MDRKRGDKMIAHEVKTVTPSMAEKWLRENNTHNRPLFEKTIENYAREMKAGAWTITNQGIGFADDGVLLDGQQRLSAIVKAGVPIKMLVVTGLPRAYKSNGNGELITQDAIDVNKPRSAADILRLSHGTENANNKMAIANMIVNAIKGVRKISPRVGFKIIDLYEDEIEFTLSNRGAWKGLSFTPAITGIILAAKVDLDKAMSFKEGYFKGENLSVGNPALTFRNYMLSRVSKTARAEGGSGGGGIRMTVLNYSLTALKHHFAGTPLKGLKATDINREYFLGKQKECVKMITEWLAI